MNSKEVEQLLLKDSKNNNSLAKSYLSLLENATPEMREYWFNFLGSMIGPILQNKKELSEAAKENK